MEDKAIIDELVEIGKRIDHFMGRINHGASFHDNKAIQDWNNGNFGIRPLIVKINNAESAAVGARDSEIDNSLLLAMEYGFKEHEKGYNLEKTRENFKKVIDGGQGNVQI